MLTDRFEGWDNPDGVNKTIYPMSMSRDLRCLLCYRWVGEGGEGVGAHLGSPPTFQSPVLLPAVWADSSVILARSGWVIIIHDIPLVAFPDAD